MINLPTLRHGASRIAIVGALAGLAVSACQPNNQTSAASSAPAPLAAIPLAMSGAPPIAPAPVVAALPPAPPASVGQLANPEDRYAFADQAYAMESAFGDAPPDYTFDYGDGQRPWVWRGDDQSTRVAEALPGGGYRYYYYEPGAQTPYLVRDSDYSYGYDNGALVVIYDSRGQALPQGDLNRQADIAGHVLARAAAIYLASQRQHREAVAEADWAARRRQIDAERAQWSADQAADQDWRAYHAQHDQQEQAQWSAEQYRREAEAARFAQKVDDTQLAAQDWQAAQQARARAAAAGQIAQSQSPARSGPVGFGRPTQPQPPAPVQLSQQPQPGAGAPAGGAGRPQTNGEAAAQAAASQAQAAGLAAARQAQLQAQQGAQIAAAQAQAQHQAQVSAQAAAAQAQAARLVAARQAQLQAQAAATQAQAQHQAQLQAQRQAQIAAAQAQAQHQAQVSAQAAAAQAQAARFAAARQAQLQAAAAQAQAQHQAQLRAQIAAAQQAKTTPQPPSNGPAHARSPSNSAESGQPAGR